jgi:hypothetical protein
VKETTPTVRQTIDGDDGWNRLVGGSRGTGAWSHLAICAIQVSQVDQATDVNALQRGRPGASRAG